MKKMVVAVALLAGSPALGADWRLSNANGDAHAYIDVETMRRTGQQTGFWTMLVYRDAEDGVDNSRSHIAADCGDHSFRILSMLFYEGHSLVDQWTPSDTGYAPPDSLIETSIKIACHSIPVEGKRVDDPYARSQQLFRHRTSRFMNRP